LVLALMTSSVLGQTPTLRFNLTYEAFCTDRIEMDFKSPDSINVLYDPVLQEYTNQTLALNRDGASLTKPGDLNFQYMYRPERPDGCTNPTSVVTDSRYPGQYFPVDRYLYLPYKSLNNSWDTSFIVPVTNTNFGSDCSNLTAILSRANLSAVGVTGFNSTDKKTVYYLLNQPLYCTANHLAAAGLVGAENRAVAMNVTGGDVEPIVTGCYTYNVTNATSDETFVNGISWNWAFWLLFLTALFVSGYAAFSDNEMLWDTRYRENYLTNYGPYSLHYTGTEQFPKHARLIQIAVAFCAIVFFNGLFVKLFPWMNLAVRLIVIPICSVIFAFPFVLFTGFFLNDAYNRNHNLVDDMRRAQTHEERRIARDRWEHEQFRAYYRFYVIVVVLGLAFLIISVYFLHLKPMATQGWWLLAVVIGMLIQLLIFDVILTLLARGGGFFARIAKLRGFYLDYETEEAIVNFHLE